MKKYLLFASLLVVALLSSCSKDDPETPNEEEVITTLSYVLTPNGGGDAVTFKFQDLDGDGSGAPVVTNGTLAANTTYTGAITLLNETEDPAENITEEVEEEAKDHQFFFDSSIVTVAYNDKDADNNPIGLATTLTTKEAGSGTLKITLRHEPNKSGDNVSTGDITNAGGETDIEVTFTVTVE